MRKSYFDWEMGPELISDYGLHNSSPEVNVGLLEVWGKGGQIGFIALC